MSKEDLILKLEQHVFNDKFALEFEDFANKNCDCFEDTEENKLEYTAIHNEFCANFNSRIEDYLKSIGASNEDLAEQMAVAIESGDESKTFVLDIILAMTEFMEFKRMMVQQKKIKDAKKTADTGATGGDDEFQVEVQFI